MPRNFGLPPWHLWGGTKILDSEVPSGSLSASIGSDQLAKVSYKRPESWRFFFQAKLLEVVGNPLDVHIFFDINTGVGRAVVDSALYVGAATPAIEGFVRMRWAAPVLPSSGALKYTYESSGSQLVDGDATTISKTRVIVAQDIQCQARLRIYSGVPGNRVKAEVSAFFAPNVHVRPDWFEGQYPGNETGGL